MAELMREEPPRRARPRLLHDAGPRLRPEGFGAPPDAGRGSRRRAGRHVPVRALPGHRGLLARPDAAGDPGEHPNGLLDFGRVCSTIAHLRESGARVSASTSPPCAPSSRAIRGTGWASGSSVGPSSVSRACCRSRPSGGSTPKYEPSWLPRYIVFDSAEQFVPVAVQIMRAESLTEVPVIGRLLTTGTAERWAGGSPRRGAGRRRAHQRVGDGRAPRGPKAAGRT